MHIYRIKYEWRLVRKPFEKEKQKAAEYSNRKRADYKFVVGHDVLISKRKHYRGMFGDSRTGDLLSPKAVGHFTIIKKITDSTFVLDVPEELSGRAHPVIHSSNLIPYKTIVLDPVGMLP